MTKSKKNGIILVLCFKDGALRGVLETAPYRLVASTPFERGVAKTWL